MNQMTKRKMKNELRRDNLNIQAKKKALVVFWFDDNERSRERESRRQRIHNSAVA